MPNREGKAQRGISKYGLQNQDKERLACVTIIDRVTGKIMPTIQDNTKISMETNRLVNDNEGAAEK